MTTSAIFKFPSVVRRHHEGPLGIHVDAYEALLREQGYSRGSTYVHLHIVADLSRWLRRRRLDAGDVDECTVERYLQSRQRFVDTYRGASFVPYKFLGMLRDRGIVTHKTVPIVVDPREIVVDAFRQYLSQERGLSVSIQCSYTRFAIVGSDSAAVPLSCLRCLPPMSRDSFDATLTSAAPVAPNTSSVHYEPSCDICDTAARLRQTLPPVCPRWRTGHYRRYRSSFSRDKYSKCLITAIGTVPWACATMRFWCCWRGSVCGRAK